MEFLQFYECLCHFLRDFRNLNKRCCMQPLHFIWPFRPQILFTAPKNPFSKIKKVAPKKFMSDLPQFSAWIRENNKASNLWLLQLTRATKLIHAALRFKKSLEAGNLEPDVYHLNPKKSDTDRFRTLCRWENIIFLGWTGLAHNVISTFIQRYMDVRWTLKQCVPGFKVAIIFYFPVSWVDSLESGFSSSFSLQISKITVLIRVMAKTLLSH